MEKTNKAVFKDYKQDQMVLLPPSLEELIPYNHPVRVVNKIISEIDLTPLLKKYKGGGTSSFHPRMMMKVIVYAYVSNMYSSRKMEAALKENIHFMWLSGMNMPDHNTLNRFRSERLKNMLKEVFARVVEMLMNNGHLRIEEVYTDGTKIEANANRYTYVWGKAVSNNKERMEKQLKELWEYAESVAREELKDQTPTTFAPIDPEQVKQTIEKIDNALAGKPISKEVKTKLKHARKNWPKQAKQYKEHEDNLAGRNSYSKTDTDATFMRMKEDHLGNGQLRAAYNVQVSSNDQYIVNYSIHQNPGDTGTLSAHLESFKKTYGIMPETVVADAGYGSEQNYKMLEDNGVHAYIKYPTFYREQQKNKNPFLTENLRYNKEEDCYYCPKGERMEKTGEDSRTTVNGFTQSLHGYQAQNCQGCALKSSCYQAQGNRTIWISHKLREYKEKIRADLQSPKGIFYRKKRGWDVETVFANIKQNKNFKRFMLKGLQKVEIEFGLIAIALNLKKVAG